MCFFIDRTLLWEGVKKIIIPLIILEGIQVRKSRKNPYPGVTVCFYS